MKTYTCIFIIAIVFLGSCKSNSFLNQRYTRFDNSAKRSGRHHVASAKHTVKEAASPVATTMPERIAPEEPSEAHVRNTTGTDFLNEIRASQTTEKTSVNHGFVSVKPVKDLRISFSGSAERLVKNMKHHSTTTHRGLIFGIINLALFIVICVLIVAGILFLLMFV